MRRRLLLSFVAAGLAVFAMTGLRAMAEEPTPEALDVEALDAEVEEVKVATTIDFMAELDAPFPSLVDLGARIERGRRAFDAVELAIAAQLLAAAEKASGNQASITAEHLWEEAVTLAKDKNQSAELTAVAAIIGGETASELDQFAAGARISEEEAEAARERGEVDRHIRTLHLQNRSHETFDIIVYGRHHHGHGHGHDVRHLRIGPHGHRHMSNVHSNSLRAYGHRGTVLRFHLPPHEDHHLIELYSSGGHHHDHHH